MALKHWKKISEEVVHANPWWDYKRDVLELPNGKQGEYFYVGAEAASTVIPVMTDGRLFIQKQYRYLWDAESWEFPVGNARYKKEDGTFGMLGPEETARRELQEETGMRGGTFELVGVYCPVFGFMKERHSVFIARDIETGEASPEETEEFEQRTVTAEEFDAMVRSGKITNGVTLSAWALARNRFLT